MADSNVAIYGLIGAAIGAVPALISAVGPWMRARDRIARERRLMELAKLEVEFVSSWLDAADKLEGADLADQRRQARERLGQLIGGGATAISVSVAGEPEVQEGRAPVQGRTGFLVYLGFYAFMLFGNSLDEHDNPSMDYFLHQMGELWPAALVFAAPLAWLGLRWYRSALAR